MIKWDIDEALNFVRKIQPVCMEAGYYIALCGGVLNKGFSNNDLDLVAMPRTSLSKCEALRKAFDNLQFIPQKTWDLHTGEVRSYEYNGKPIEVSVVRV